MGEPSEPARHHQVGAAASVASSSSTSCRRCRPHAGLGGIRIYVRIGIVAVSHAAGHHRQVDESNGSVAVAVDELVHPSMASGYASGSASSQSSRWTRSRRRHVVSRLGNVAKTITIGVNVPAIFVDGVIVDFTVAVVVFTVANFVRTGVGKGVGVVAFVACRKPIAIVIG